jgi:hypothetical protein
MAKIPMLKTLEEIADFWDTHDFEDYVDDTVPVEVTIDLRPRKKKLTLPLDAKLYRRIEVLAARRGVPVTELLASWFREKAMAESS